MSCPGHRKGSTLATTVVVVALVMVLGLALSSATVSHLQFASAQGQAQRARDSAEAAIALAIEKVIRQPNFGENGLPETVLQVPLQKSTGYLTFHPSAAADLNLPLSVNNKSGTVPVVGWGGRSVPPGAVQLIGLGRSGGKEKIIEAVLQVPEYPYALASSGPISSSGGLLIGGVDSMEEALESLEPDSLRPADLASNATGIAVKLDGDVQISGDIQAVGTVSLGPDVHIDGEVKPHSEPVEIAPLNLQDFIPDLSVPYTPQPSPRISEATHSNAPELTITGGLELDDGILSVNGDLKIYGGVKGRGALLVNGKVEIFDGARLAAQNQVALVAKDDVLIHGNDASNSFFQGLIYTEGDLEAENMTLLGTFVANRPQTTVDPGSRLTLEKSRAVHLGEFASFETERRDISFSTEGTGRASWSRDYTLSVTAEEYEEFQKRLPQAIANFQSSVDEREKKKIPQDLAEFLEDFNVQGYSRHIPDWVDPSEGLDSTPAGSLAMDLTSYRGQSTLFQGLQSLTLEEVSVPSFRFDLNEFLSESSRNRIILWLEH